MNRYRMTVDGVTGRMTDSYPLCEWTRIADTDRVSNAMLERQSILTFDTVDGAIAYRDNLTDATGYIRIGARIITPWEVIAQMEDR